MTMLVRVYVYVRGGADSPCLLTYVTQLVYHSIDV